MNVKLFFISLILAFLFPVIPYAQDSAPPAPPAPPAAASGKARFDYALGLYMQGSADLAADEFRAYLKDFPKGDYADDSLYWLGKYRMGKGTFSEAEVEFTQAISDFPASDIAPSIQFELGFCYYSPENPDRDLDRAFAEFMKVPYFHQDSPIVPQALYYAARCQMGMGKYSQARKNFSDLASKFPDSPYAAPALYASGLASLMGESETAALTAFQAVRDRYPAGLYRDNALAAIELVARGAGKKGLTAGTPFGSKGEQPGQFVKSNFLAMGTENELYVSDTGNARVQRLGFDGKEIKAVAANIIQAQAPQTMSRPVGVAAGGPRERIYVTDAALNQVQVYSNDGRPVNSFGKRGQGIGEMDSPAGIAVGETGEIFVSDRGNRRVEEFWPDGSYRRSFTAADGGLRSPQGIAIGLKGEILVADDSADRVFVFSPDGKLARILGDKPGPEMDGPYGVCVDGAGNVYVSCRGGAKVVMFDRDLKFVSEFPEKGGNKIFDAPTGIAVAADGTVLVMDSGMNQIIPLR